jgi:cell division protein FtsQ
MLQFTDKKTKLFFYLILFILLSTQIAKDHDISKSSTIKSNHIEVFGLSNENNLKVLKSLNSLSFQNIFFINQSNFYKILKENNLIESFYIKKFYPNVIKINIKQTDFLAITTKKNKKFYIGSNGKLIPVGDVKDFNKELPFVFSKSNYADFVNLKKIIDKSKFVFEEIESFYYFPSNRWDLKTNSGLLIKLPEKNILESLQFAYLIEKNRKFKNNKIIDLRISNRIIVSDE